MAKGSATIDVTALKVAGAANKYITYIDDKGIRVHEAGAVNIYQANGTILKKTRAKQRTRVLQQ